MRFLECVKPNDKHPGITDATHRFGKTTVATDGHRMHVSGDLIGPWVCNKETLRETDLRKLIPEKPAIDFIILDKESIAAFGAFRDVDSVVVEIDEECLRISPTSPTEVGVQSYEVARLDSGFGGRAVRFGINGVYVWQALRDMKEPTITIWENETLISDGRKNIHALIMNITLSEKEETNE